MPPRTTMHAPLEQPSMPPWSNHACPPRQPRMPPRTTTHAPSSKHACPPPPAATTHAPPAANTHAPREQPRTPLPPPCGQTDTCNPQWQEMVHFHNNPGTLFFCGVLCINVSSYSSYFCFIYYAYPRTLYRTFHSWKDASFDPQSRK